MTGFSVRKNGLLITCMSGFAGLSHVKFQVRKLNKTGFSKAKKVFHRCEWDLILLQVADEDNCEVGEFATSLVDGETIFSIGHPTELVGSFSVGHATYRCSNTVNFPLPFVDCTCAGYSANAMETTPEYRVAGHAWNEDVFKGSEQEIFQNYKDLHPLIPIIQCSGLSFSPECAGGPVFNMRGQIVGMIISEIDLAEIAIHASLLEEFLKLAIEKGDDMSPKSQSSKGPSRKKHDQILRCN